MSPTQTAGIASILGNKVRLPEDTSTLSASWENAKPFKHIILDDFFDTGLLERVCREIPRIDDETWVRETGDL